MTGVRRAKCDVCGEWIRNAIPRQSGAIICADCSGETKRLMQFGKRESGEGADRQYHGGQFNKGEW